MQVINEVFKPLVAALPANGKAISFLKVKGLNHQNPELGFIGKNYPYRYNRKLTLHCGKHGLLHPLSANGYSLWGSDCIVFPLKDELNRVVCLYGQGIENEAGVNNSYLSNRKGLYPHYPSINIPKLLLTNSIINAALLLQHRAIAEAYNVLALDGVGGLTEEHFIAIMLWASRVHGKAGNQTLKDIKAEIFLADDLTNETLRGYYFDKIRLLLPDIVIKQLSTV